MAEPIGSGRRFRGLAAQLAKNPKIKNPAGLAAKIGRKKYGPERFNELAQAGKRRTQEAEAPAPVRRIRL